MKKNNKVRKFDTGATRSDDNGKLKYEGFLSPVVLHRYAQYMDKHRVQKDGTLRAPDNWQKGIPKEAYMDSLIRHTMDLWRIYRGDTPIDPDTQLACEWQDLLCALLFNISGLLHTDLNKGNEQCRP